jgi:hypothetical protein
MVGWSGVPTAAQDTTSNPGEPGYNPNKQDTPPAAGGPQNDVGPYVVPKKKEEPPAPPPEKPKRIEGMPDYSIKVDVPLVSLDVLVTTKDGQFVPGLHKDNFKILEVAWNRRLQIQPVGVSISRVLLVGLRLRTIMVDALKHPHSRPSRKTLGGGVSMT